MGTDTAETELEAQLARLTGTARIAPLMRLAQLLSNRFLRLSTGSAAAAAVLDSALAKLREARTLMPADDPNIAQVDSSIGWLLSFRYAAHGSAAADRDEAITLLSGSVDTAKLAPLQQQGAYVMLGQLSAMRALQVDPGSQADPMARTMGWMSSGLSPQAKADLDRAHDYLNRVLRAGPVNDQVRQSAEAMLQMVTMIRDMFGGFGGGNIMSNFSHLMGMMSRMGGSPAAAAAQSPLWTQVGAPPIVEGTVIPPPPAQRSAPTNAMDGLRGTLLRDLAGRAGVAPAGTGTGAVARVAGALLHPEAPLLPWDEADDAVATATVIHDSGDRVAADGVLLAVTLYLRARADDGGGWADDPGASAAADRRAGLEALVDAASALPPDEPLAGAAVAGAAAFLADVPSPPGIPDDLLRRCAERCDAVAAARPGIRALREVCRAGLALRAGWAVDADAVERAASAVPTDEPWRTRLLGALGGALFVHSLPAVATDVEPARRALALISAADPAVAAAARALVDGADDEVARHTDAFPEDGIVRAVAAEFGAGPVETLDARAVGRVLDAPVETFAVAAAGARRYLLGRIAERFGAGAVVASDAVADVMRSAGIDVVVYVHPVGGDDLCMLVVEPDGKVTSGGVITGPLLAPVLTPGRRRVVLVAPGDIGALPWAAAPGSDDIVLWTVGSVERLLRGADHPPREVDARAVFVANPAGDRDPATVEAMVLRRMLYPTSTGLGRTVEQVDGPGTPDEVLAHVPGASLLHLGCAVRTTPPAALGLADGTWLDVGRVAGGGLVVLPADAATDPAGLLAVADTLLDAGMTGAVHWLRPVPPPVATLVLYRLHEYLVDDRMQPPDAVAAVRRWMRDPDRQPPRCTPAGQSLPDTLTDPAVWGALSFRS